mmetsp:Transcript_103099/g.204746  ORF Transcript_103099/g.204746 Transcript_103099/m.204746 type:complete len:236 (-) Transcript_103099:108-815(-)
MPRRLDGPGPGSYDVLGDFGRRSKSVTLKSGRTDSVEQEPLPGPGDYMPRHCTDKSPASCKFGLADRFGRPTKPHHKPRNPDYTPGPTDYTPRDPKITSERKSIGERFRGPHGLDAHITGTPGPGAYSPRLVSESPRTSAANFARATSRWMAAPVGPAPGYLDGPGPAAYQHEDKGRTLVNKRPPAAAFGTTPRIAADHVRRKDKHHTPGPGSYNIETRRRGPRISIAPRRDADF